MSGPVSGPVSTKSKKGKHSEGIRSMSILKGVYPKRRKHEEIEDEFDR